MDHQNNSTTLNDNAGVLPMDTEAATHDEGENRVSSSNSGVKRGRGRPAKYPKDAKQGTTSSELPKRSRGRPSKKVRETSNKTAQINKRPIESSASPDPSNKKHARISKTSNANEQISGGNKSQAQTAPVATPKTETNAEPAKKKRGRPSGASKKNVTAAPKPSSTLKETSSGKKRGRPPGSAKAKKAAVKEQAVPNTTDGSTKKRGRPRKRAPTSSSDH